MSDRVIMTENGWTGLALVVGLGNGRLDHILISDSTEGFGDAYTGVREVWTGIRCGWGLFG